MLELLFLLLPVAAGYGWVMGRNSVRQAQRKQSSILSRHYYKGLNFLLSDQPDKAVDTLIKMINLNSDTVETHIAMGNFFRHRGEIDRAIKVHQNLVSREELSSTQRETALKELGLDYNQAGFLERAENAFLKLLQSDKHRAAAQSQLFSIYQTTKEWRKAIQLAESAVSTNVDNQDITTRLAHFYCELSQQLLEEGKDSEALQHLQKAVNADDNAVRPWLLLAHYAVANQSLDEANQYLEEVARRDKTWISEAIYVLVNIAERTDSWQVLDAFLEQHWQQCGSSILAKTNVLAHQQGKHEAAEYLVEQLRLHPTMKGFKALMDLYINLEGENISSDSLTMLKSLVEKQITLRPRYRCTSCGFSGKKLYWLCPSCKKWGVVKPIKGLDGE
ncbi:lipopolysaccharide assembly protein LapB [Alteromonas sediminis]|uniref:Lipopolysaccharide assembly protein B n=1 Tax=Alteromonas sediminis TaxID=2259342 RepID=A0A3N5Y111_9ALTE|nr:lipopolysaccharide assembly protein LapB [Alteromonas sediminis]RPJ67447.1 lipopolysaccharide assembly protein LapB [Alteromonas sediminis]